MSCQQQASNNGGDRLEVGTGNRPFDHSATAWLVGQAVRYLNAADKEGELAYQRVVELLRHCSGDVLETVVGLFRQARLGDAPFRWSLLYILADSGDASAADFLVQTAVKPLPEANENEGCEGPQDAELLVCTMAVVALQRIAGRHPEVAEPILKIVSARPARAVLIEAVKAARELGLAERVRQVLPQEDHWIFGIRRAHTQELFADPQREDGKERGFTPPKTGLHYTAPRLACCTRKEN